MTDAAPRFPRVTRDGADRCGRAARAADAFDLAPIRDAAGSLFGAEVSLERLVPSSVAHHDLALACSEPWLGIAVERAEGGRHDRLVLEIEPGFALSLLDRALGGSGGVIASGAPPRDVERGMLAYLAGRLLGDGKTSFALRSVLTTPLALPFALGERDAVCVPYACQVGTDRGVVRVWASELPEAPSQRDLPDLPLSLVASMGRGRISAGDVARARAGDVLLLDEVWARVEAGVLVGEARLEVPGTGLAWQGKIQRDAIVVRGTVLQTDMGQRQETTMGDISVEQIEGAMFEARVEVARFAISAAELGQMREGEILRTGTALGGEVAIRIGERAFATGEIVDVDGEIGVRILRLDRP